MRDSILVTLYKDLFAVGYTSLFNQVKLWLANSPRSLQHNAKVIQQLLAKWGKTKVNLGTLQEWKEAVQYQNFSKDVGEVHLWLDTTDLRLVGKQSTSCTSHDWSYKCNSPGHRYAFLSDADGQIRKLWGGYSPKVYDGNFLELNAQ